MKILLLAGGDSNERSVSLESGEAVFSSLKRLGHIVYAMDPATGRSLLNSGGSFIAYEKGEQGKAILPNKGGGFSLANTLGSPAFQDIDCIFITLHGGSGEDGVLQCLIEIADKKYTGSNMAASAIAMDKAISKRLAISENIKTADFVVYRLSKAEIDDRLIDEITHRFELPVVIKPNDGGSTLGLSKVDKESELPDALRKTLNESNHIMVEQYIKGKEITAAIMDGKPMPLVEIRPKNELYDFEAKYQKGMSDYIVPAELSASLSRAMQQAAMKIYNIIGCSGLARVDFILDESDNFYFLELNSLPGMTQLSLAPMAAAAAGLAFDKLIEELIHSAIHRSI